VHIALVRDKCIWSIGGMIIMGKLVYLDKNWPQCMVTMFVGAKKRTSALIVHFL
jgi:hypothetical protein